jgi:hypothetical protein
MSTTGLSSSTFSSNSANIVATLAIATPVDPISFTQPRGDVAANSLRRGNREQGKALEALSHALEYLVDSRMFLIDEPSSPADAEAVQILARLSRKVFSECGKVEPFRTRLRKWMVGNPTEVAG